MAMFKFLKNKLKETVEKFTKKAQEDSEVIEEDILEEVEEPVQKESQEEKVKPEEKSESVKEEVKETLSKPKKEKSQEKKEKSKKTLVEEESSSRVVDDEFVSVDDLIPDVKEDKKVVKDLDDVPIDLADEKKPKEVSTDPVIPNIDSVVEEEEIKEEEIKEEEKLESAKEEVTKTVETKKLEEKNKLISKKSPEEKNEFKEEENIPLDDDSSDFEVDPLIEEVIEKNKSFEEAEQQTANAPDIDSIDTNLKKDFQEDSKQDIIIKDELKQSEIVDDGVEDSDVVEDLITVSDEDVIESDNEPEKKKGFFKRIFGKKDSVEEISDDNDVVEDSNVVNDLVEPEEKNLELKQEESDLDELTDSDDLEDSSEEDDSAEEEDSKDLFEDENDSVSKDVSEVISGDSKVSKDAVHKDLLTDDIKDTTKKKKGFFGKIKERVVKFQLTDEVFEELFWDFELALLEGNVASEVIEKIKSDLKETLTSQNVSRKEISEVIFDTLKSSLDEILSVPSFDLLSKVKSKKPFVICMVGVNGSGKTTHLAKLVNLFQKNNLSIVVAAADTFRAAAIQQLEEHTTKLGVKLIKHDYNADPAAVAYDAIKHAQAKGLDIVLIDTAGRLQSNSNLMDELRKLVRVNKPDLTLFVGESITGNDCVEQAVAFNEAVGIDGIILSKADVDDKGGAAISVSYVTKKPILYLGTGQTYDDLKLFNKSEMLETLGL